MWCHVCDIKHELCSSDDPHYPFSTSLRQTGDPSSLCKYSVNWKKYANILARTEILQKRRKRADVNYEIRLLAYINKFLKILLFVFLLLNVCTEIRDNFQRHFSFSHQNEYSLQNGNGTNPVIALFALMAVVNAVHAVPLITDWFPAGIR